MPSFLLFFGSPSHCCIDMRAFWSGMDGPPVPYCVREADCSSFSSATNGSPPGAFWTSSASSSRPSFQCLLAVLSGIAKALPFSSSSLKTLAFRVLNCCRTLAFSAHRVLRADACSCQTHPASASAGRGPSAAGEPSATGEPSADPARLCLRSML